MLGVGADASFSGVVQTVLRMGDFIEGSLPPGNTTPWIRLADKATGQSIYQNGPAPRSAAALSRELDLVRRDGNIRRVSVSATAVYNEDGSMRMSRTVLFDISELSRMRNALRALSIEQEAMLDNDLVGIVKLRNRTARFSGTGWSRRLSWENAAGGALQSAMSTWTDSSRSTIAMGTAPAMLCSRRPRGGCSAACARTIP